MSADESRDSSTVLPRSTPSQAEPLPFIDLAAQQATLRPRLRQAIDAVLGHGRYVLGPEVARLEAALGDFCGARHTITCANGTDALVLALRALGVGREHAVIVPDFTFCATAEAVALVGATPVFADVRADDFALDPDSAAAAVRAARERGLEPVGIVAVDLFGVPADYASLHEVGHHEGLWVLADAAQSFGASRGGRVGTLARITTTSFFPAKPLGCYGDGGAVFCDDDELDALLRSLRVHGSGGDKYDNVRIGLNSRLDSLQAAVLLVKLEAFAEELAARARIAERYAERLADLVTVPRLPENTVSSWAQYSVVLPDGHDREAVQRTLRARGVPSAVYYGKPLHRQTAYRGYPAVDCPVAQRLADHVLALPMHAYLSAADQDHVVAALRDALA